MIIFTFTQPTQMIIYRFCGKVPEFLTLHSGDTKEILKKIRISFQNANFVLRKHKGKCGKHRFSNMI